MSEFKLGDRVRYSGKDQRYSEQDMVGHCGTVRYVYVDYDGGYLVDVCWDDGQIRGAVYPGNLAALATSHANILPEDDDARAAILLATCLLDYFPNACAAVAAHSAKSNAKHNPGQSPHWARDKSTGHRDKIVRHLIDAGGFDKDGNRHSTALAWRGLALLEDELIAEGATPGRNAKGSPDALVNQQHNCIEDEM